MLLCCSKALEEASEPKASLDSVDENDDQRDLVTNAPGDSISSNMLEPSGPPFGIVLNGHSLVRGAGWGVVGKGYGGCRVGVVGKGYKG